MYVSFVYHATFMPMLILSTLQQMPPLFLVNVISYWQAEGSSVLYPCPLCEGIIHIAEQTANEGLLYCNIVLLYF